MIKIITSITHDTKTNQVIANLSQRINYKGYNTDKICLGYGVECFIKESAKLITKSNTKQK